MKDKKNKSASMYCTLLHALHAMRIIIHLLITATFILQVGRFEINLISPDTKSVVLEKNFKDISSCSQVSVLSEWNEKAVPQS